MRRKAGAGRPPPDIGRASAASVLSTAFAQSGEDVAGLIAAVTGVEETRTVVLPFSQAVPEHALLSLVEGPAGGLGVVVADGQMLGTLIEIQTTGRVTSAPLAARPATRTDAILAADFIDRVLELFETGASEAGLPVAPAITGYRYAMALGDTRAMLMTLPEINYRLFRVSVDLGQGARTGKMELLFPYDAPRAASSGAVETWQETLAGAVCVAQASMDAVVTGLNMTFQSVASFEVGTRVRLPADALSRIVLRGEGGRPVSSGRLGQVEGFRAVRISPPVAQGECDPQPAPGTPGAPGADLADIPPLGAMPDAGFPADPPMGLPADTPMGLPGDLAGDLGGDLLGGEPGPPGAPLGEMAPVLAMGDFPETGE